MEKRNKKQQLLAVLGVFGIIAVTIGATYAFFSYTKTGTTANSITTGSLTFLYDEQSKMGRGILIEDAIPQNNAAAKIDPSKVFDFRVTASTGEAAISYVVTAKKDSSSTLDPSVVNLYLTDQAASNPEVFLDVTSFTANTLQNYKAGDDSEKIIYEGLVAPNQQGNNSYSQDFRLRMWIDENTNFSGQAVTKYYCGATEITEEQFNDTLYTCPGENVEKTTQTTTDYPYNNKLFKITVNVYATGRQVSGGILYNSNQVGYYNSNSEACENDQTLECALDELAAKLN